LPLTLVHIVERTFTTIHIITTYRPLTRRTSFYVFYTDDCMSSNDEFLVKCAAEVYVVQNTVQQTAAFYFRWRAVRGDVETASIAKQSCDNHTYLRKLLKRRLNTLNMANNWFNLSYYRKYSCM